MFPTVVFTGAILYVFYYLEIMEVLVKKFGWLLNVLMGTSAAESLSTAGNVFVGMVSSELILTDVIEVHQALRLWWQKTIEIEEPFSAYLCTW